MKTIKHRWDLINELIERNQYTRYLEIGYDNGINFNNVYCENKESVDPAMGKYAHATPTFKMTSDEFFENWADDLPLFDIVFIDGLHEAQQVDRDILNALQRLSDHGTIILHDCNPTTKERQMVPRIQSVWNGDVWKSLVKYRAEGEWNTFTLDVDEGLGVIQKGVEENYKLQLPEEWDTYEALAINRESFLGLREPMI